MKYVLGFVFDNDAKHVILMQKKRPMWQAGRFNGIGGKIELLEDPMTAMEREAKEEIGLVSDEWEEFAVLDSTTYQIHVFHTFIDTDEFYSLKAQEDEAIFTFQVSELPVDALPNLRWLIPMALDIEHFHSHCML